MNLSAGLIRKLEALDPKMKDVLLCFMEEVDEKTRIIAAGRNDFDELKDVVRQLAEAQSRTEKRVEELAEAQAKTEVSVRALTVGCQFAPDVEAYAAKKYPRILRYKTFQITAHEDKDIA